MIKAGLIVGAVMFILVLLASATVSPLCALCLPLFTGLGAGYLTGVFDHPAASPDAAKRGAVAGAIAGGIAIIAQIAAAIINAVVFQNPQFNPGRLFGMGQIDPTTIWVGQIFFAFCVGALNVVLTGAFGAAGGALWLKLTGKDETPAAPVM